MAKFEDEETQAQLRGRYVRLKLQKQNIVANVQAWSDEGTTLHAAATDPEKQAEVLQLRTDMVAEIRAALGI